MHVGRLEAKTGKRFGRHDDPLLVSVRSGAAVSMPGMMDTILNLGLNDEPSRGWRARTGNPRFAYDSYRRLIQMYGEVVDGIDGHGSRTALAKLKAHRGRRAGHGPDRGRPARAGRGVQGDLRRGDRRRLSRRTRGRSSARGRGGVPQLGEPARAGLPARRTRFPTTSGPRSTSCRWCSATRATIPGPASRSRATRRPASAGFYGEFLVNAQGEDVVAGIRTPQPLRGDGGRRCPTRTSSS